MRRRMAVEVLVALVAGVALGVGAHLWLNPAGATSAASVAGAAMERLGAVPDQVTHAASASVLEVHATGCGTRRQASATLVRDADGRSLLLTNRHVVRGAGTVEVVLPGAGTVEVAVLGALVGRDGALLDPGPLVDRGAVAATVASSADVGDEVVVAGHPGRTFQLGPAAVVEVSRRAAEGAAADVLVISTPARGGISGGGVFDPSGSVVGLVAARDPATGNTVAYRIEDVLAAHIGGAPGC